MSKVLTVDFHQDVPWQMTKHGLADLSHNQFSRDVDFKRMKEGGLDAAFWALYLPDSMQDNLSVPQVYDKLAKQIAAIEAQSGCVIAQNVIHAKAIKNGGSIPIFLAVEGARLLHGDIASFHKAHPFKYLTLVHNVSNQYCQSATDPAPAAALTMAGKQLVADCESLGVLVDVSHASEAAYWQVSKFATKPILATHSGCRALVDHPRNLTDLQIKDIAKTGGVIGIPWVKKFIGGDSLAGVIKHINHVCQLLGNTDHIAIGSDLDGANLVGGKLTDVAYWGHLISELDKADIHTSSDIDKILGGNILRVLG